ncbi:MAG: cation diffusion facilitator family transporter [Asticcacaulis sp.]
MKSDSKGVVFAALAGNLLVAATKTVAALFTGSSAMASEAVHSFVDSGNQLLLLYGMRQAKKDRDENHPLGYGRELYFWSFVVAILVFAGGGAVSIFQGVFHLHAPEPIENPFVSYLVLGLSLVFEGGTWWVAARSFHASKGSLSYWQAIVKSKDPPKFMVLLEDSAAIIGIVIALIGTWASVTFDEPRLDGIASILIGLVLTVVAIILARESKALLIGERASQTTHNAIVKLAGSARGIVSVNYLITSQLGPQAVIAALSLEFEDQLKTPDIEDIVDHLEKTVRTKHPEITALFVKPEKPPKPNDPAKS